MKFINGYFHRRVDGQNMLLDALNGPHGLAALFRECAKPFFIAKRSLHLQELETCMRSTPGSRNNRKAVDGLIETVYWKKIALNLVRKTLKNRDTWLLDCFASVKGPTPPNDLTSRRLTSYFPNVPKDLYMVRNQNSFVSSGSYAPQELETIEERTYR